MNINFWIPIAFSILFELVKNPATAAKYRAAMVKLRDSLILVFPLEDFTTKSQAKVK